MRQPAIPPGSHRSSPSAHRPRSLTDLISRRGFAGSIPEAFDAVLDLVGNSTIVDSMSAVRPDGRACMAGFLGGGDPIGSFNPMLHMPSGVHLSFFASAFTFVSSEYPLSGIPFQAIADRAAAGAYKAEPARIFPFEGIQDAHRLMESNQANGKIVVTV